MNFLKCEIKKCLLMKWRETIKLGISAPKDVTVNREEVFKKIKEESIRLIGIDTPESRINKKTKRDANRSGQDIKTIIEMGK